jgi:hypothetical protein
MLQEYDISALDPNDETNRQGMLSKYRYSVILEGNFMELDNLDKWIRTSLNKDVAIWLFYGKTDYNYGFAEYSLMMKKKHCKLLR